MLFTLIWLKGESLNAETGMQERHLIQPQPNVNPEQLFGDCF